MLLLRRPGKSGSQSQPGAKSPIAMVKPRLPLPVADCDEPLPGCLRGPGEQGLLSGRRGLAAGGLTVPAPLHRPPILQLNLLAVWLNEGLTCAFLEPFRSRTGR